jgi:protein O-mannosyl-transferase
VKKILAVLLILVAVCLAYAPAARDGFVWDDTALVLRDPLIRSWRLVPESFNHFLFVDATQSDFYRPLQRLSYTFDYALFAFRPGPYHLVNIFWHAAAAIALFLFAAELLRTIGIDSRKAFWVSLVAAVIWGVHSVESAAVIYVSGRADSLAAFFGFLGLFLAVRSLRAVGLRKLPFFIGIAIAFLASCLSKEYGFVFLLLGISVFVIKKSWLDIWRMLGAVAFVCAVYFSLRLGAEHFPPPPLTPPAPGLVRPVIVARAVAEYSGLIVLPLNLHMDREVETQPLGVSDETMRTAAWRELQTLLGILLSAALVYWAIRARRRNPAVFACLLFAVISYLPISGVIALNATVAEHWIYAPSAFLFIAIVLQLAAFLADKGRSLQVGVGAVIVLWVVFLGVRTFIRTFDWKTSRIFFERTIANGGDSARMLINLGVLELNENKLEDAAVHLHAALNKKPDQPLAIINLATLAMKENDFKLARELAMRATNMPLVEAQAHELLAILEMKENKRVDLMRLRLASHTGAPNWDIEKRYIMALNEAGSTAAAINELLSCLQSQWYRAESWQLLGELHKNLGHSDQANMAFAQARAYDVHLANARPGI